MKLSELKAPKGSVKRTKRRGRGPGSGHGKTSCRGHKGANARSGSKQHIASEGGQMPLIRRMPKRGFNSDAGIDYQVVNVEKLNRFTKDAVVNADILAKKGMVKKADKPIKILGKGKLENPVTIKINAVSGSARKRQ